MTFKKQSWTYFFGPIAALVRTAYNLFGAKTYMGWCSWICFCVYFPDTNLGLHAKTEGRESIAIDMYSTIFKWEAGVGSTKVFAPIGDGTNFNAFLFD